MTDVRTQVVHMAPEAAGLPFSHFLQETAAAGELSYTTTDEAHSIVGCEATVQVSYNVYYPYQLHVPLSAPAS